VTGWISILTGLALVGFVLSIAVSASYIQYEGTMPISARSLGSSNLVISAEVGLSNQGVYSLEGFHMSLHLLNPQGELVATGSTATSSLPARSTVEIPLSIHTDLSSPIVSLLVTHNSTLKAHAWINATYATLVPVHLTLTEDYPWGAPFYGFSTSWGTPSNLSNGTVSLPIHVSFANYFPIPDYGTLGMSVFSTNGTRCGGGSLSLPVIATGSSFSGGTHLHLAQGCDYAGGTLTLLYTDPLVTLEIPPQVIP
jgi:hypothetical protein